MNRLERQEYLADRAAADGRVIHLCSHKQFTVCGQSAHSQAVASSDAKQVTCKRCIGSRFYRAASAVLLKDLTDEVMETVAEMARTRTRG